MSQEKIIEQHRAEKRRKFAPKEDLPEKQTVSRKRDEPDRGFQFLPFHKSGLTNFKVNNEINVERNDKYEK